MHKQAIEIQLLQKPKTLRIDFDDGQSFTLPCRYLRQHSPSAEARNCDESISKDVNIISIEAVGQYAIKLIFDDGHKTGIYSWDFLYQLGLDYAKIRHLPI